MSEPLSSWTILSTGNYKYQKTWEIEVTEEKDNNFVAYCSELAVGLSRATKEDAIRDMKKYLDAFIQKQVNDILAPKRDNYEH